MIVSLYRTLGITLHTVRADYNCVWWLFSLYQVLNRTIRSAAVPYPNHGCRRIPAHDGTHAEPLYVNILKQDTQGGILS